MQKCKFQNSHNKVVIHKPNQQLTGNQIKVCHHNSKKSNFSFEKPDQAVAKLVTKLSAKMLVLNLSSFRKRRTTI